MKKLIIILMFGTIYSQCLGDLNEDGMKNILDIVILVSEILDEDTVCEDNLVDDCGIMGGDNYDLVSGYNCTDLSVLQEVIDTNSITSVTDVLDLGTQIWSTWNNRLYSIIIDDYNITTIPESIGNLDNLTVLRLSHNQLSEMPSEIGNLINLTDLDLSFNQIAGVPPMEIGNLVALTNLDLSVNQISGIPPEIGNLVNLLTLDLHANQITEIPTEIGSLMSLVGLFLGGNQLTALPESLCNVYPNLTQFYVSGNSVCGEVPSCLEGIDLGAQGCP